MNKSILAVIYIAFSVITVYSQPKLTNSIIGFNLSINSKYHELNPEISADGKFLFFTRDEFEKDKAVQDCYMAEASPDGTWGEPKKLEEPFNYLWKNSITHVSLDGSFVVVKGVYKNKQFELKERGYSIIERSATGWEEPRSIKITNYNNYDKGLYNGMTMTPDHRTIIFTLSTKKDEANNDLYISFMRQDSSYTEPVKLKVPVNTEFNEFSPFLAADNTTLYFASDRPGGLGKSDIWMVKRLDSTWTSWSEPYNLGHPVNTEGKEGYFTIDARSEFAYMVKEANEEGNADIVKIKLENDQKANPTVIIYGNVYDAVTRKPIKAVICYEYMKDGLKAGEVKTNPVNGYYKIVVPYGEKFVFLPKAKGYLSETDYLDLTKAGDYKEVQKDLFLVPIRKGMAVNMNNIYFKYNSAELKKESFSELNRILEELNDNPELSIEIRGHTDNVGSQAYNLKLSSARANSVKKYLIEKGVDPGRLQSMGFGKKIPVASNTTAKGQAMNRRVDFIIL